MSQKHFFCLGFDSFSILVLLIFFEWARVHSARYDRLEFKWFKNKRTTQWNVVRFSLSFPFTFTCYECQLGTAKSSLPIKHNTHFDNGTKRSVYVSAMDEFLRWERKYEYLLKVMFANDDSTKRFWGGFFFWKV